MKFLYFLPFFLVFVQCSLLRAPGTPVQASGIDAADENRSNLGILVFEILDRNHDNKIELIDLQNLIQDIDVNEDGAISPHEMDAGICKFAKEKVSMIEDMISKLT
jgi:hypothetical protein